MEEIKIIDPLTDPRWDAFVAAHPYGWIVHTSGWKKVIESTFPHMKGHYFALVDSQTNNIKAGLPIYEIRSWLTGNRLVSVPFATLSDPLISSEKQAQTLAQSAIDLLKRRKLAYVEIRSLETQSIFNNHQFRSNNDYKHHFIDLTIGEEAIWKNISYKSIRYVINKANKNNVTIKTAENIGDLQSFYHLYLSTRKRLGLPSQPYSFFESLWNVFSPSGNVRILLAISNEKVVAALFSFLFNGRVSAEATGEDILCRHLSANQLLFWEAIKSSCAEGYKIFDFGRTSIYNTTLMNFKKRWGSKQIDFFTFFYDGGQKAVGATSRENSASYQMMRFLCHHTPGPCFQALSNFCYRHLG